MHFRTALGHMDIAEQVAGLINTYNDLSHRRTPFDIIDGATDYIVETHGRWVLGCCGVERQGHQLTEIKHLSVNETWRGKGVGKFLVTRAIEMCETPLAYATVRSDNSASLALFRGLGFQEAVSYPTSNHNVTLLVRVGKKWEKSKPDWQSVSSLGIIPPA